MMIREPTNLFSEPKPLSRVSTSTIQFQLERREFGPPFEDREDEPYFYYCLSCLIACGDKEAVFKTGIAPAKKMQDGPTDKQQTQMSEHAEQHSIIWNWARQQDKR